MHYNELFRAAKLFRSYPTAYENSYEEARTGINWKELGSLSNRVIKDVVLLFLNRWNCRIPKTDDVAKSIKNTYKKTIPFLKALDGEVLQDVNFDDSKKVDEKELRHYKIIRLAYSKFSLVGYKFGEVAASKVLHMINPELFVMWDNAIPTCYGLRLNSKSYSYGFMPVMQYEANEAITTYMKDKDCERDTAIKEITSKYYGRTLAKLVDEYNWMRIRAKCLTCRFCSYLTSEFQYKCSKKQNFVDPVRDVCDEFGPKIR